MKDSLRKYALLGAWIIALFGMAGSLFFSELQHLLPCILCWYQRIALYPLVVILGVGYLKKDKNVTWYAAPLIVVGWVIALYHTLLDYKIIPEAMAPCVGGVPCVTDFRILGILTIPLLSFTAFTLIGILVWLSNGKNREAVLGSETISK